MVREIVHVQVGQCGNQVGKAFWETVAVEHCIGTDCKFNPNLNSEKAADQDGDGIFDELENIDVYFRETNSDSRNNSTSHPSFVARALVVDLEPGTVDVLKASAYNQIFSQKNLIFGANGAGNNWAKGHYTEGAELVEQVMDAVRIAIEECEAPQGFQLCHSLGGGTGSGMGTLLLLKIRDGYPDRITTTYSVYPSPKVSDTVVEPYNAVLSSHQLLENSDETFIIDNEALYNISHNVLKEKQPTYADLNGLIATATCGITASLRFPGKLNGDLRKLGVNLVPFPRLHFFLVSQAPILSKDSSQKVTINVQELTSQAYGARNFFSNVKPDDGKYLAASFSFRGKMSTQEVDDNMEKLNRKSTDDFVEWIPNNLKNGIVEVAGYDSYKGKRVNSCTLVANTTALKGIFQRLATQFGAMYKRKAFLHWYKGEGMDEMEFQEADKNVRDLITEYQDKQDASYDPDSEADEDEDEDI
jgi:tubulin beta